MLKKMSFWNKVKATLLTLGIGGEVWMHVAESSKVWKGVGLAATIVAIVITNFFEDKNNNDIVDALEDKNKE